MKTIFFAKIFPPYPLPSCLPSLPKLFVSYPQYSFECSWVITFDNENIICELESEQDMGHSSGQIFVHVYADIQRLVSSLLAVRTIAHGIPWKANFTHFMNSSHESYPLFFYHPELPPLLPSVRTLEAMEWLDNYILLNDGFAAVLREMSKSISSTDITVVECARAIERLAHLFSLSPKKSAPWEAMRSPLNISKGFLEVITEASKEARHGKVASMDVNEIDDVRMRAWQVLNRYIEYLKNNSQPLNIEQFPLL